ncbi:MAG: DUF4835 family protein [Bacteroidaceae bacterium]|nr:DUF4835 family protein [Bacteroidaceae bacterium]
MRTLRLILLLLACLVGGAAQAQELNARVNVNHQKVQGTDASVFDNLQEALTRFINERQWTQLQYARNERINCAFNITVNKYDSGNQTFECTLTVQATRPVYGSTYTTPIFATTDESFNFRYVEFENLEFRPEMLDNDLTALVAYYCYLIIGLDLDTFAPMGGTDVLEQARNITQGSQSLVLSAKGWKAFDDMKNRYAIINDYLDSGLESMRRLMYTYHREGLDVMAENAERGRSAITDAIELLGQAHSDKPLSLLPQLFTEFKRDEIVAIYQGKATAKEKDDIYNTLSSINASMNVQWRKIQQ